MSRVLEKLQQSIADGNYYEAHQMYKSIYNRYVKQGKGPEARELVLDGSFKMFNAGEYGSAADLALMYVNALSNDNIPPTLDICVNICKLFREFPCNHPQRPEFISKSISWTSKYGAVSSGEPALHNIVSEAYCKEKLWEQAEKHVLLGTVPECTQLAMMIIRESSHNKQSQICLNFAHFVLKFLSLGRVKCADLLAKSFQELAQQNGIVSQTRSIKGQKVLVYNEPMANFAQTLVLACISRNKQAFLMLKQNKTFAQLSDFNALMIRIGERFFGLRSAQPNNFGNLLQSLFAPQQASPENGMELD